MSEMEYRGAPTSFAAIVALCSLGPMTYEVIQPLSGPSIWADHLQAHGDSVHHLGYYVDDIDEAVAAMAAKGYEVVQSGRGFGADGDGAFAYFDTTAAFGCYMESILGPRALVPPQRQVS